VLAVESDVDANLTLLAPEVDGAAPGGAVALKVEVLGASENEESQWPLLADAPVEVSNCTVLLSSSHAGQRVLGRLTPKGDALEVTTARSPEWRRGNCWAVPCCRAARSWVS